MLHRSAARDAFRPLPFSAVCITWAPVALGTILGTFTRATVYVFGGELHQAITATLLWAAVGAALSTLWVWISAEYNWRRAAQVSATWVLLTVGFRALWLGVVLGGRWSGILADYRIWEGQPGLIVLGLVAVAPVLPGIRRRRD